MRRLGLLLALLLATPAAAEPSPARGGWTSLELHVGGRILAAALSPKPSVDDILTIVIEGDGAAHDARGSPRGDPTPRNPVGRRIAMAWPSGGVAWLGRPCQYVADPACRPADWTTDRFSTQAVETASLAIDDLKALAGARRVRLVGWSGGGVLAALLTARRDDVAGLVTVAAPLDLAGWTLWHGASALPREGDPARLAAPLQTAQLHLLGAFDTIVPPVVAQTAARRLAGEDAAVVIGDARHTCCWTSLTPMMARVGR